MSKKISRNDPCPCGSGKKYKRCCLNNKRASINKTISKPEEPLVSRLALVRFGQELIDRPEQLEEISKKLERYGNEASFFKDFILKSWNIKKVREMGLQR